MASPTKRFWIIFWGTRDTTNASYRRSMVNSPPTLPFLWCWIFLLLNFMSSFSFAVYNENRFERLLITRLIVAVFMKMNLIERTSETLIAFVIIKSHLFTFARHHSWCRRETTQITPRQLQLSPSMPRALTRDLPQVERSPSSPSPLTE